LQAADGLLRKQRNVAMEIFVSIVAVMVAASCLVSLIWGHLRKKSGRDAKH